MLDLILLAAIGIPFFGSKMVIYLITISREMVINYISRPLILSRLSIIALLFIVIAGALNGNLKPALATAFSYFIGTSIASRSSATNQGFAAFVILVVFFHLGSFLSLYELGYDFLPQLLYGESRHAVPLDSPFPFRPSGFLTEPSTLCVLYFALILLSNDRANVRITILLVIASLLTFSAISLLSIALVNWRKILQRRVAILFTAMPIVIYIAWTVLLPFATQKISFYSSDLANYSRTSQFVNMTIEDILFGRPKADGVILDNGALFFLIFQFGVFSLPLVYLFIRKCLAKDWRLLILLFTKLSPTFPLLWYTIYRHDKDSNS